MSGMKIPGKRVSSAGVNQSEDAVHIVRKNAQNEAFIAWTEGQKKTWMLTRRNVRNQQLHKSRKNREMCKKRILLAIFFHVEKVFQCIYIMQSLTCNFFFPFHENKTHKPETVLLMRITSTFFKKSTATTFTL